MRRRQRGAAILMAMLTVVLVATMASAMMWQEWRGFEVESAQRTRVQSAWILTGALDWARLILREDGRQGGADNLSEPWAVPLAPARLSSFLAAERGQALVSDDDNATQQAFLAGHMEDLQGRLNVANLLDGNKPSATGVAAWLRLFDHLNLPESELFDMTQALLLASTPGAATPGTQKPLWPTSVPELAWLGLSDQTLQALQPYITILPQHTPVNLNTAPAEVLLASVAGLQMAQAQDLVQARAARHMATLDDAARLVKDPSISFDANLHSVSSRFFSVTGQLRVGDTTLQERSVLQRDGLDVKTLSRVREVVRLDATQLQ